MLNYLHWSDRQHPHDEESERARRVALYAAMVQEEERGTQAGRSDDRHRQGPYARPVWCEELRMEFPTLRAAADHVGTKRAYLRTAIRKGCRCVGYTFRYVEGADRVRIGTGRERAVLCVTTGQTLASITEAARHGRISASALCGALKEAGAGGTARCGGKLWTYAPAKRAVLVQTPGRNGQLYLFDLAAFRRPPRARQPRPRILIPPDFGIVQTLNLFTLANAA